MRRSTRPTRGWLPQTPRTQCARSHPCRAPMAGRPNGCGCKRGWLTRSSATTAGTAHGGSSLSSALRLAEPEQLRLPFVIERGWIGPDLRRDHELADTHRRLLAPAPCHHQRPAPPGAPDRSPILPAKPLSGREREVPRLLSGLLGTAEIASEMYISINTVKTHLPHIYRKPATTHRGEAVRRARQLEADLMSRCSRPRAAWHPATGRDLEHGSRTPSPCRSPRALSHRRGRPDSGHVRTCQGEMTCLARRRPRAAGGRAVLDGAAGRVHDPGGALQTAPILLAVVTAFLVMEAVKYRVAQRQQARAAATKPPAAATAGRQARE